MHNFVVNLAICILKHHPRQEGLKRFPFGFNERLVTEFLYIIHN